MDAFLADFGRVRVCVWPPCPALSGPVHPAGSGKTGAYVLGMLSRIDPSKATCQAIAVCPTRELARQVADVVSVLGKFTGTAALPTARGVCVCVYVRVCVCVCALDANVLHVI